MLTLAEFLPLLGTHVLGAVGHLLARIQFGLHRLDIEFTAEYGLPAVLLAGLYLPGHGPHGAVVGDAEEILIYFLGTGRCFVTGLIAIEDREIGVS